MTSLEVFCIRYFCHSRPKHRDVNWKSGWYDSPSWLNSPSFLLVIHKLVLCLANLSLPPTVIQNTVVYLLVGWNRLPSEYACTGNQRPRLFTVTTVALTTLYIGICWLRLISLRLVILTVTKELSTSESTFKKISDGLKTFVQKCRLLLSLN